MVAVIQEKNGLLVPFISKWTSKNRNFWLKQRAYINCKNNNNGQNMINKYQKCFFGILSEVWRLFFKKSLENIVIDKVFNDYNTAK